MQHNPSTIPGGSKTGSIYSFKDVKTPGHVDDEWFICNIKVEGKKITVTIDGKVVNEYTEPADHKEKTKRLGKGTVPKQPVGQSLFHK